MHIAINDKKLLLQCLSDHRQEIKSYGVKELGLFGSFARNSAINSDSDVDLLVRFEPGKKSFDNFMDLAFFLEDLLGRKVELVTLQSLSKYIGPHILNEVENVNL